MSTITIPQLTRIEGHLAVHAEAETVEADGKQQFKIKEARCEGEMFRGLEKILEGRDPLDAQQITQRVCGVCPISHGMASVAAQEMAYQIKPCRNGRIEQNLIHLADYLHSHVLHLYQLAALDFVDVTAVLKYTGNDQVLLRLKSWIQQSLDRKEVFPAAPFLPRYEANYIPDVDVNVTLLRHYVDALDIRRVCHEMGAVFGARLPHATALVPGGCTQVPTVERILSYASRLKRVLSFLETVYLPDVLGVAKLFPKYFDMGRGYGNFLSFGVFPTSDDGEKFIRPGVVIDGKWAALDESKIAEDVRHSWFDQASGLHPDRGEVNPAPKKSGAYTWIKAPRYAGVPMEVGALARVMTNYHDAGNSWMKTEVDKVLKSVDLPAEKMVSVLGRHLSRALEAVWMAREGLKWLDELEVDAPPATDFKIPKTGHGYGLTEAPRGALGHWLTIEDYRIKRYQAIVPTTWNCSPRDDKGQPGPVEYAIAGTVIENPAQPIEVGRIVRSFDPCIACAVH